MFSKDELYKFYNLTKGSITNIFKYKFQNSKIYYLIRTKALRDIIDIKNEFNNYNELINYLYNQDIPQVNYISIALSQIIFIHL